MRSRLREYRDGLNGGEVTGRWGALGRSFRETRIERQAARRAYVAPEDETVEEEEDSKPAELRGVPEEGGW